MVIMLVIGCGGEELSDSLLLVDIIVFDSMDFIVFDVDILDINLVDGVIFDIVLVDVLIDMMFFDDVMEDVILFDDMLDVEDMVLDVFVLDIELGD